MPFRLNLKYTRYPFPSLLSRTNEIKDIKQAETSIREQKRGKANKSKLEQAKDIR